MILDDPGLGHDDLHGELEMGNVPQPLAGAPWHQHVMSVSTDFL